MRSLTLERSRTLGRLTPRETDVLAAMAEGRTNAAIADGLFLSRRAVEKHINSIFSKLSLTGNEDRHARVQAVLMYLAETGVTEGPSDLSSGRDLGPASLCPARAAAHHARLREARHLRRLGVR